jgi:hypothetical protein
MGYHAKISGKHIFAGLLAACAAAAANAAEQPEFTIRKITATIHEELRNKPQQRAWCGAEETLRIEGKFFLTVEAELDVAWIDEVRQLRIDPSQITLVDDRGDPCPPLHWSSGTLKSGNAGFYAYRPHDWQDPEKAKPAVYEGVFMVPTGCGKAQLSLAAAAAEVTVPDDVSPLPPLTAPEPGAPAKFVIFEITDARLVDEVPSEANFLGKTYQTTISNPQGKLLEVQLKITPTRGNDPNRHTEFTWKTGDLGFRYGEDKFVVAAGERFRENSVAHLGGGLSFRDGTGEPEEKTVWFAVPADLDKGLLTYMLTPVAEITPGGPYTILEIR